MKRKLVRAFSVLWPIIVPVISAFLGLKAMGVYNLFEHLGFVQAENAFDVGATVYFAVIDVILSKASDAIKSRYFAKQSLEVIFSEDRKYANAESDVSISVNDNKPTSVIITIRLDADKVTCKNLQVKIMAFNIATMQLPSKSNVACVDQSGNFIIDLSKLFNQKEHVTVEQSFKLLMLKDPVVEHGSTVIEPELSDEPIFLSYKTNKVTVRTEG